jgi:uncharacterized membrane protein
MNVRTVLLVAHVFGAIMFVGPVTVAASIFPRHALAAVANASELPVAQAMHRIASGYGLVSLVVPAFGGAMAGRSNLWGATWLRVAVGLYACATALLLTLIVPRQGRVLERLGDGDDRADQADQVRADIGALRMLTGLFSMLWIAVLVLMVAKPS